MIQKRWGNNGIFRHRKSKRICQDQTYLLEFLQLKGNDNKKGKNLDIQIRSTNQKKRKMGDCNRLFSTSEDF